MFFQYLKLGTKSFPFWNTGCSASSCGYLGMNTSGRLYGAAQHAAGGDCVQHLRCHVESTAMCVVTRHEHVEMSFAPSSPQTSSHTPILLMDTLWPGTTYLTNTNCLQQKASGVFQEEFIYSICLVSVKSSCMDACTKGADSASRTYWGLSLLPLLYLVSQCACREHWSSNCSL